MSCYNTQDRVLVRTERRYKGCGKYVNVKIYRKVDRPKKISELREGDRHPVTGARIPSQYDKYAPYPGPGFCRTVRVKRVKKYVVKKVRTLVSSREVARTPISGWHPCKKGDC